MKKFKLVVIVALLFFTLPSHSQNWFQISSGTIKNLNTIHFPTPSVGYIGGDDSLLLKTIDGGLSWNAISFSGASFFPQSADILNLHFVTNDIGFMTFGPYANGYKTIDGGLTWTPIFLQGNNCFNQGMFFFDENNGFIGGSGCFQGELIARLSSGIWSSATMNSSTSVSQNLIVDIDFHDSLHGLAASTSGLIFRTTDGGLNWDSVPSNPAMYPITSVLMINDTLAYAGYNAIGVGFGLYISTDGGLSWNYDGNSATFFYPDFLTLHQSGNGEIFSGGVSQGSQGLIFRSPGDMVTWNFDVVDQQINDISSYNDSTVFAVGDSGYIVVNKILTGLNPIHESTSFVPLLLSPNPAQQYFNIIFPENVNSAEIIIRVVSVLGEMVLLQKNVSVVDVRNLSAGVYLVEALGDGFVGRGKLMVE
ncbi:MAG: T9SS type A sorting domain-containing protein [Bacteroidia bacterium]